VESAISALFSAWWLRPAWEVDKWKHFEACQIRRKNQAYLLWSVLWGAGIRENRIDELHMRTAQIKTTMIMHD
jgi:hypothetical protein